MSIVELEQKVNLMRSAISRHHANLSLLSDYESHARDLKNLERRLVIAKKQSSR